METMKNNAPVICGSSYGGFWYYRDRRNEHTRTHHKTRENAIQALHAEHETALKALVAAQNEVDRIEQTTMTPVCGEPHEWRRVFSA